MVGGRPERLAEGSVFVPFVHFVPGER